MSDLEILRNQIYLDLVDGPTYLVTCLMVQKWQTTSPKNKRRLTVFMEEATNHKGLNYDSHFFQIKGTIEEIHDIFSKELFLIGDLYDDDTGIEWKESEEDELLAQLETRFGFEMYSDG